jgi:Tfp pilus assembly protein PilX
LWHAGSADCLRVRFAIGHRVLCREERGIALLMALGVLIVLSIITISVLTYTATGERQVRYGAVLQRAQALAEGGVNNAEAVLNNPANNALNASLLPPTTTTIDGGTVSWSGQLDQATAVWTVTSTGQVANPTGAAAVTRTVTARVRVVPALANTLNSQAWNYIYDWGTGQSCDMTLTQSVEIDSPLYVEGNLCMQNTATIASGPLVVKGRLTLAQKQNAVGSASAPINEAHIGNGCKWQNNQVHTPCAGAVDNVFASVLDSTPPPLAPPTIDWDSWYANASPGPNFPCYEPNSSPSNTWPTFDSDTVRNDNVIPAWNLTPTTAYDCWTSGGELKWDPIAHVLTADGTIFIDGSVYVNNGSVNTYSGQATLYLSGSFLLKNSSLCAIASGAGCDSTNWDPNTRLLIVVANGSGDNSLPVGDSAQLVSASFQGGVYATNRVELDTSSSIIGPIVGQTVALGQSTTASFPFILVVPSGAPGNPNAYAQPGPPIYTG